MIVSKQLRDRSAHTKINYNIHRYSSYASNYIPENIKIHSPADPSSRWSTASNDHTQFIVLKYEPSVVTAITFGKFSKIHVCNVKELRVSVSMDDRNYVEVLHSGLKNSCESETFTLKCMDNDVPIVSRFIKIEPLAAWGVNFNYSIWYVQLNGVHGSKEAIIARQWHRDQQALIEALRILKRQGYRDEYASISQKTGIELDNQCFETVKGYLGKKMYEESIRYIDHMNLAVFDKFIEKSEYIGKWTKITCEGRCPCERGGHQMVSFNDKIYMYGGWDGTDELEDLWIFHNGKWREVPQLEHDPGLRSCHKMAACGDKIVLIGKYVSALTRDAINVPNDIWVYKNSWYKLECSESNKPKNVFDHALVYGDGFLYCFGGKITGTEDVYGGLYLIDIDDSPISEKIRNARMLVYNTYEYAKNTTNDSESNSDGILCRLMHTLRLRNSDRVEDALELANTSVNNSSFNSSDITASSDSVNYDNGSPKEDASEDTPSHIDLYKDDSDIYPPRWYLLRDSEAQPKNTASVQTRIGHSMVYIPKDYVPDSIYNNSLVIVGGQKGKDFHKNIMFYAIDTDTVFLTVPFPFKSEGRTIQRSILYKTEILTLFTYSRERDNRLDNFEMYTYSLISHRWSRVKETAVGPNSKPVPRSAHQFILHNDVFILFGGSLSESSDLRSNDMWELKLHKMTREEVCRMLIFIIRKYQYLELVEVDDSKAIQFLRNELYKSVYDEESLRTFEIMCNQLFEKTYQGNIVEEIVDLFGIDIGSEMDSEV